MAATPPRVGQLVLCQQQEVTWCVLAPGAPGPSARSGNCTSGAGGLGGPEGGPAAVRGCCLSPPSIMTQKSRVGDAAWGSVTLGSGHSSGSPRLHPQLPRCWEGGSAESAGQWAGPGLGRSWDHCSRNNEPWKSAKPGKVGVPRGSPSRPTFSLLESVPGKSAPSSCGLRTAPHGAVRPGGGGETLAPGVPPVPCPGQARVA